MAPTSNMPRTWFARAATGETLFVRRFDPMDEESFYEIYGYSGDMVSAPSPLTLPESIPERITSLEEACGRVARSWDLLDGGFADATLGRQVSIDLVVALQTLEMAPLRAGMVPSEVMALLGMPEAANRVAPDGLCWFYGAVQFHFERSTLIRLEIDRGIADFTSLLFEHWFLKEGSTLDAVAAALVTYGVPSQRVIRYGLPMLDVGGGAGRPQFVFDFDPETSRIHAMYWDPLVTLGMAQPVETQPV